MAFTVLDTKEPISGKYENRMLLQSKSNYHNKALKHLLKMKVH